MNRLPAWLNDKYPRFLLAFSVSLVIGLVWPLALLWEAGLKCSHISFWMKHDLAHIEFHLICIPIVAGSLAASFRKTRFDLAKLSATILAGLLLVAAIAVPILDATPGCPGQVANMPRLEPSELREIPYERRASSSAFNVQSNWSQITMQEWTALSVPPGLVTRCEILQWFQQLPRTLATPAMSGDLTLTQARQLQAYDKLRGYRTWRERLAMQNLVGLVGVPLTIFALMLVALFIWQWLTMLFTADQLQIENEEYIGLSAVAVLLLTWAPIRMYMNYFEMESSTNVTAWMATVLGFGFTANALVMVGLTFRLKRSRMQTILALSVATIGCGTLWLSLYGDLWTPALFHTIESIPTAWIFLGIVLVDLIAVVGAYYLFRKRNTGIGVMNQFPGSGTPSSQSPPKHIVFLVHGIRDYGDWLSNAEDFFRSQYPGTLPVQVKYGYYALVSFISRAHGGDLPYDKLRKCYTEVRSRYKNVPCSIIAHSFGTDIVSKLLKDLNDVNDINGITERVIFCSSVASRSLPANWINQTHGLLSLCGRWDPYPYLAELAKYGYEASGVRGFVPVPGKIHHRWFDGSHGCWFQPRQINQIFADFLFNGHLPPQSVKQRGRLCCQRLGIRIEYAVTVHGLGTGLFEI